MIETDAGTWYSASDLLGWLGCHHRTTLDALALTDRARPAHDAGGFDTPAKARGDEHERAMLQRLVDEGRSITSIDRPHMTRAGLRAAADETLAAMRAGADVIFQAALLDPPWFGFADFLVRVDGVPSGLGGYAYEVRDTKLARHPAASALIQMAHYGAILQTMQDAEPPLLLIWLGTGEEYPWDFADAAPYLREVRSRFLAFRGDSPDTGPEPVAACPACRWLPACEQAWGPDDLIHVHRLGRHQRASLNANGIDRIADLAGAPDRRRPTGMATATFDRLREQASVQAGSNPFRLIRPQSAREGLVRIPAPHPGDLYFDLEGDPFAAIPTLDYLWAFCDADDVYSHRWAHTPDGEREAFAWLLDLLLRKDAEGGDWHVYHYNTYELTSLRRIAADWPDRATSDFWVAEVERLISTRFVDLYRAVEAGLRTQHGSTSLKVVEKLAGYDRAAGAADGAVSKADDSIVAYEAFIASEDTTERGRILDSILDYNTHDVRATHAVHLWLHELASQLEPDDLLDEPEAYQPSAQVLERIEQTAELRDRLQLQGADMLAAMLEWHRAELVVQFLDFLRLKAWALEEAAPDDVGDDDSTSTIFDEYADGDPSRIAPGTEHESVLLGVTLVDVGPPTSSRKNAARPHYFTCRPGSWKIKVGDAVETARPDADGASIGMTIAQIDVKAGTFTVRRGTVPKNPGPLVLRPFVGGDVVWESLMRLGEQALSATPDPAYEVALQLLDRQPPLDPVAMAPRYAEDASDRARRIASAITCGVLPVQGPPGTGKTWLGARLVADALKRGGPHGAPAVIAVTANSHRVIDNLLLEVADYCASSQIEVAVGHAGSEDKVTTDARVTRIDGNPQVASWISAMKDAHRPCVIGATKYAWARPDLLGSADVLIVDEAGQLPLADALAVTQCAPVVIALGDPQQLAAPIQAAHDASIEVSLLEHLAQGRAVLPPDVGVFLDRSHRMHGALCSVVAALAYNGELQPAPAAARRDISGRDVHVQGSRIPIRPGVAWLPVSGDADDEVDATLTVISGLLRNATVTLEDGSTTKLEARELLVVAPHNAHVNRIAARAPRGIRVGTVDKFQGQQGHVVVYSMGRVAASAGDVPFLYEINRLNVALSRARLLAVVVSHADATFPPVQTPEQLMLASRFIRAVEGDPSI